MNNNPNDNIYNKFDYTQKTDLKEFIFLIKKRIWLILFILITTIFTAIIVTLLKTPIYESTTTIAIENPKQAQTIFNMGTERGRDMLSNEMQIITSRTLAEEVVRNLLDYDGRYNMFLFNTRKYSSTGVRKIVRDIWESIFGSQEIRTDLVLTQQLPLEHFNAIVASLKASLSVQSVGNTNVLKITIRSINSLEAALICNIVADTYQARDLTWSTGEIINLRNFLSEQLSIMKLDLQNVEDKLKSYSEQEKIYGLDGNAQIMLNKLSEVEAQYYNNRAEITIIQEKKRYISKKLSAEEKTLTDQLLSSINNRLFAIRNQIAQNEADLIKNVTIYGRNHEAVQTIQRKINGLKTELATQTQDLIAQGLSAADPLEYRQSLIDNVIEIDNEEKSLLSRAKQYKILVDQYSNQLNLLPAKSLQYARLERDKNILNETYLLMRQKYEEVRISEASELGKVRIIDTALPPSHKSEPNTLFDLLVGFILGLGLCYLFIIILEKLDRTIKSGGIIENLGLTVLGIVPNFLEYKNKSNKSNKKSHKEMKRKIIEEDPMSPISESFRSLRTNLIYTTDNIKKNSIIISSPGPEEGKTTIVTNLAIAFAHMGKSTLLIDADLRRPRLHNIFNFLNEGGLTDYLTGVIDNYYDVIQPTDIENLSVLTAGNIPHNPSELLSSEKMANLISNLEERWDIILIDSPPIVAVTDAMIISKSIDSLVLVVMAGKTEIDALMHSVSIVKHIGATLSGVVLNGLSRNHSYSSYYYYHHYYYHDKHKKKMKS